MWILLLICRLSSFLIGLLSLLKHYFLTHDNPVSPPPQREPSPPPQQEPSPVSSHFFSVSTHLPQVGVAFPPFPSPLTNISLSDIDSPSSDESQEAGTSQRSKNALRFPKQKERHAKFCRHRSCCSRCQSVSSIARWLFQGSMRPQCDQGPNAPLGSPQNLILLPDDSD